MSGIGRVRDELTSRVVAVSGAERERVTREESGPRRMSSGAVGAATCGAFEPSEVTAGVGDEEEVLWGSSDGDSGKVLTGTYRSTRDEG